METDNVSAVLVHGAWADGSSWSKVIERLKEHGIRAVAAPSPDAPPVTTNVLPFSSIGSFPLIFLAP